MNNHCGPFQDTPSDDPFAPFEFPDTVEHQLPSNTVDSVSQLQHNVPDPSSHIQDPVTPLATTSSQWQGSMYPAHASDPFWPSDARFEFLEPVEHWQPDSTEGSVSWPQPNVPGPSSPIQRPISPPVATSSQWQGSMYPVHASDAFRDTSSDHPFARFEFPENAEDQQPDKTEDSVSQLHLNFPGPSSPIRRPIAPPVDTTSNQSRCFICQESFLRWQERDRHELWHLPFFLHCPVSGCSWRGNRENQFKKHWRQKDPSHRSYREQHGRSTPGRCQIETFNPKEILDRIKNGAISLSEGQDEAIFQVQVKSYELDKPDMTTHPWGRNRRH